jgi:hypothetical protein
LTRARRRLAALAAALAAAGLPSCVHERSKALAIVPEGALSGAPAPERPRGVYRSPAAVARGRGPAEPAGAAAPAPTAALASARGEPPSAPQGPAAAVPPGTDASGAAAAPPPAEPAAPRPVTGPYEGHRPVPAEVSLEQLARERFLNSPTVIEAEKATVHLPPAYLREATLTGLEVVEEGPGRRSATGSGVLVLRRLTIRASRITLVARDDGLPDLSVSARGGVAFRADLPGSVLEERDLKSLLIRNDRHTPLR